MQNRGNGYLGLDIGGTRVKAAVFDSKGAVRSFSRHKFVSKTSKEGYIEIPITDIHKATQYAVKEAAKKADIPIKAISISSQGETFVTIDKNGNPLHNAILWYDSRAIKEAKELEEKISKKGKKNKILPILTVPKILWLKKHKKLSKVFKYLLLPDYFSWILTGIAAYDPNTAESTGAYDSQKNCYDKDILDAAAIEECQLSTVLPTGKAIGKILPRIAKEWNLSKDTILVSGTNDQYAGALGAGNYKKGIVSITIGTCLAMITLLDKKVKLPSGMFMGNFPIEPYYFLLAYAKTSGVVIDWFCDNIANSNSFKVLINEASKIPIGSNSLFAIPHFDGIVSPEIYPNMKGAFIGLSLQHSRAELFRSLLESFAFIIYENLKVIEKYSKITNIRVIGGGAKNDLFLQITADTTGKTIERPSVVEAASLGAAMIAAVGTGDFKSLKESSKELYHCKDKFYPKKNNKVFYEKIYNKYQKAIKLLKEFYN